MIKAIEPETDGFAIIDVFYLFLQILGKMFGGVGGNVYLCRR